MKKLAILTTAAGQVAVIDVASVLYGVPPWTYQYRFSEHLLKAASLLLALLALLSGLQIPCSAALITAQSTAHADVQAAVDRAQAGDTVKVPAGESNWSASVKVRQPIYLEGAGQEGTNSTTLFNTTSASSGLETPIFQCSLDVDQRLEISNFWFSAKTAHKSNGINLSPGKVLPTKIVIHDCTFKDASFAIMNGTGSAGACFGVVYHCTFWNCRVMARNSGFLNEAALHGFANGPYPLGSAHYMVFEDDTINFTDWTGGPQGGNYMADTEYPFNYMVRHCNFSVQRSGAVTCDGFDMHGNYGYALNGFGMVIHDNALSYAGPSVGVKLADIRGGVGTLVYNNRITGQSGNYISLRADPQDSVPPSEVYVWNNSAPDGELTVQGAHHGPPSGYVELAYPHPLRSTTSPTPSPTPAPTATPPPTFERWIQEQNNWIRQHPPFPD
jgi:hypothetical protein